MGDFAIFPSMGRLGLLRNNEGLAQALLCPLACSILACLLLAKLPNTVVWVYCNLCVCEPGSWLMLVACAPLFRDFIPDPRHRLQSIQIKETRAHEYHGNPHVCTTSAERSLHDLMDSGVVANIVTSLLLRSVWRVCLCQRDRLARRH